MNPSAVRFFADPFVPCGVCRDLCELDLEMLTQLDPEELADELICWNCSNPLEVATALVSRSPDELSQAEQSWLECYAGLKAKIVEAVLELGAVKTDFGLFWGHQTGDLPGRNPMTGEIITIPSRRSVWFLPSEQLVTEACLGGIGRSQIIELMTSYDGGVWDLDRDDLADIGTFLEIPEPAEQLSCDGLLPLLVADLRARRLTGLRGLGELRVGRVRTEIASGDLVYFCRSEHLLLD